MLTRYVTFIFLVGLSALFFTSGRSAPLGDETREGLLRGVTRAERGARPASSVTKPAPAPAEGIGSGKIDGVSFEG